MNSIFARALGSDFARLHPQLQRRFSLTSADRQVEIGTGKMDEIWRGPVYTLPFLYLGTRRHILFPEYGRQIPFTIKNYAYVDAFGRETVAWIREFRVNKPRRFDAYMVYSERRGCIVDYLGTHQHLAVDLALTVDQQGGLHIASGDQRFYEGALAFPFPALLSGSAAVHEWYDEASQCFRIEVRVHNPGLGHLFGYRGSFQLEWQSWAGADLPAHARPHRLEYRE